MQCIYHASHKEVCIFLNRKPIRFQFRICYCQISSSDRLFSAVCTCDCLHFCLLFSFFSPADRQLHGLTLYFFVCFGVLRPTRYFSLIWRRHHCRWGAANFDLYSALVTFEQQGFLSMPHLLDTEHPPNKKYYSLL